MRNPMYDQKIKVELSARWVVGHQYRHFYYLANELDHLALEVGYERDAFRHTVGTVVMSFTTVEALFNHLLFSDDSSLRHLHAGMSTTLRKRVKRMSLPEKIEFALRFHPGARPDLLGSDKEPYQSFDLLRQLRNLLIHYEPERELVWSVTGEHIEKIKKLERGLLGRFEFIRPREIQLGDFTKASVYRILNRNCARWAFERVAPFVDSLCGALQVPPVTLEVVWNLSQVA